MGSQTPMSLTWADAWTHFQPRQKRSFKKIRYKPGSRKRKEDQKGEQEEPGQKAEGCWLTLTLLDFLEAMGMTRDEIEEIVLRFLEAPSTFDTEGVAKKQLGSQTFAFCP